jgi:hypothetical protein
LRDQDLRAAIVNLLPGQPLEKLPASERLETLRNKLKNDQEHHASRKTLANDQKAIEQLENKLHFNAQ